MSSFDPDFEHFRSASGYRNRYTNHEAKFDAFRNFDLDEKPAAGYDAVMDPFVIQFVYHPNFHAGNK